jgi:hypothetical protein
MPKLPRFSAKEAIRVLERLEFEQVRQTGSHVVMKKKSNSCNWMRRAFASRIKNRNIGWYSQASTSVA